MSSPLSGQWAWVQTEGKNRLGLHWVKEALPVTLPRSLFEIGAKPPTEEFIWHVL